MSDKQRKCRHSDDEVDDKVIRKPKKKKKKHIFLKIFIVMLMLLAMCFGIVAGYGYNMLEYQIDHDTTIDKNEIEINEGVSTKAKGVKNIVLYGVDARNQKNSYEGSLSDVIMIVSINQDTKKVKIASVYRDTYLQNTKTKTFDKITHMFRNGPSLSMSTLNTNLDLDITEYVAINFNVVVDVVDAVNGVTLDITAEEAKYINPYIDEVNKTTGHKSKHITKAGTYTLDGVQATAYARIRYTAGGDWKRTERQRTVLNLVFEKAKKMNIIELKNLAEKVLKQVSTNITTPEILSLAARSKFI